MNDVPERAPGPGRHSWAGQGLSVHPRPPVLLPIAAPSPGGHRSSVVPGLAASLAIMIVTAIAALALVGARQEPGEGRSVQIERSVAPR